MQIKIIKRKNKLSTFLILTLSFLPVFPKLLSTFPDILTPGKLSVDSENIYIVQAHTVFIYSLKDFKLKKKLGQKGEGPGEFRVKPTLVVLDDGFILNSFAKFIHYSKMGTTIKEKTFSSLGYLANVGFINNTYIIQDSRVSGNLETIDRISLYGTDFKLNKDLSNKKYKKRIGEVKLLRPGFGFKCYKDRIYIGDTRKGLVFSVFDSRGNSLYKIDYKYKQKVVDEDFKKDFFKNLMKNYSKELQKVIKKKIEFHFPKFFPPMQDFYIDNNKIFIKTFETIDGKDNYSILSTDGKYEKDFWMPESKVGLMTFKNKVFYYLKENEDEEMWELHAVDL